MEPLLSHSPAQIGNCVRLALVLKGFIGGAGLRAMQLMLLPRGPLPQKDPHQFDYGDAESNDRQHNTLSRDAMIHIFSKTGKCPQRESVCALQK